MTVNVATAGTYDVKVSTKLLNTRGIYQLADQRHQCRLAHEDEYTSNAAPAHSPRLTSAISTFPAAGNYAFKFTVTGKNAASTGFSIAFDDITLTPQ